MEPLDIQKTLRGSIGAQNSRFLQPPLMRCSMMLKLRISSSGVFGVGMAVLKGAPTEKGQVIKVVERIGYHRMTFYGYTWQVDDKIDANNLAYTSGNLSQHTGYPSPHNPPGIQFLHCIKQAEVGGESEIADGFNIANQLKQHSPETFRILTSTLVDFTDMGVDHCDCSVQSKNKTIELDHKGNIVQINYSSAFRDSVFDIAVEQVHLFYSALKQFENLV